MSREESIVGIVDSPPRSDLQVVGRRHAVVHLLLQLRRPHGDQRRVDSVEDRIPLRPTNNLGLIVSAFMYVYALSSPFAGQVGDRFPRQFSDSGRAVRLERRHGSDGILPIAVSVRVCSRDRGLGRDFLFPRDDVAGRRLSHEKDTVAGDGVASDERLRGHDWRHRPWPATWPNTTAGDLPSWCSAFAASCWRSCLSFFCGSRHATRRSGSKSTPAEQETPDLRRRFPIGKFLRELLRTPTAPCCSILAFFGANSVGLRLYDLDAELSEREFRT